MDYEPIEDDFRSPNIVVTAPLEQDDAVVHYDALAEQVSGQEGTV